MGIIVAAGCGQIRPTQVQNDSDNEVVDHGHGAWGVTAFQMAPIFAQRFIASIMQAVFNALVPPREGQQAGRSSFRCRKAGDAIGGLLRSAAIRRPFHVAFKLEDLCRVRPIQIGL